MINGTYSTTDSPITKLTSSKWKIGKICHEIDDVLNQLGDENYCPYEDLEGIREKLEEMTD